MKKENKIYVRDLLCDTADRFNHEIDGFEHLIDVIQNSISLIDSNCDFTDEQKLIVIHILRSKIAYFESLIDDLLSRITNIDEFIYDMEDDN